MRNPYHQCQQGTSSKGHVETHTDSHSGIPKHSADLEKPASSIPKRGRNASMICLDQYRPQGLPQWLSGQRICLQYRRPRFSPCSELFLPCSLLPYRASLGTQNGKESACNTGDVGSIPGSGRFPWGRAWQPTPVCLSAESPWTEEAGTHTPWHCKKLDMT